MDVEPKKIIWWKYWEWNYEITSIII